MLCRSLLAVSIFFATSIIILFSNLAVCTAASFEPAKRTNGAVIRGLKVEGDIVPGDAQKLLDHYAAYAEMISPIYLRSRGGNVEEAMKMGSIIRRLRLETRVPVWDTGSVPIDEIETGNRENLICASACFLVYAGGAERFGNYLALHRPFLARQDAKKISDVEYEALQKEVNYKVRAYLADMEIDQYWIDRMFAANSQDRYIPTWAQADSKLHHLMGIVPSLEEVMLSKCNAPNSDRKLEALRSARGTLSSNDPEVKHLIEEESLFFQCKETALSDLQRAAWDRENDGILKEKCKDFPPLTASEISNARALASKGASMTTDEKSVLFQQISKDDAHTQCWSSESYGLHFTALKRWRDEEDKYEHSNSQRELTELDLNRLSPDESVKKGKEAYDSKEYSMAMRLFKRGAELGNAKSMMGMSWLYGNGNGVPKDDAEALRWRKLAAENGDAGAMYVLGTDYEEGKVVPQDYGEAMRWLKMADDKGDATAMIEIANLFEKGQGVTQNYSEAMRWLKKAADTGDPFAPYFIGSHYEFGLGVAKDKAEARGWMKKASAMGNSMATQWLIDHP